MLRRSTALFFILMLAYACSSDEEGGDKGKASGGSAGTANHFAGATSQSGGNPGSGGGNAPNVGGNAPNVGGAAMGGSENTAQVGGASDAGGSLNQGGTFNQAGTQNLAGNMSVAGTTGVPGPSCQAYGQSCSNSPECCSGLCDLAQHSCVSTLNFCSTTGTSCSNSLECCSLSCIDNRCAEQHCKADSAVCGGDAECCGQSCVAGTCAIRSYSCKIAGNPCADGSQCCSGLCSAGYCALGASYCVQNSDLCAQNSDCCSGVCTIASGAKVGTCGLPVAVPSNCGGVEGSLCTDCGSCCSRLCAPYGPTGVRICQPASGCRVVGELCAKDADCCGGDPSSNLPGAGNGSCEIPVDGIVGRCRNVQSCSPQGNICHFKEYVCAISSAPNKCCDGVGNSGVCQQDTLGVPRCNGLGTTCRATNEECASADDCCNHVPCVRALDGKLRCYAVPIDGPACVSDGGSCTIDGDCCPGTSCVRPVGSTAGYCGVQMPPTAGVGGSTAMGGTSGTGGAPGNGGVGQGGSTNATTSAPATTMPPMSCSSYGQLCDGNGDCCNNVPCTNGICAFPIN